MKATQLLEVIGELIDEFGDLDVGIKNPEFNSFDEVRSVYFKEAEVSDDIYSSDSVSDAAYFIAID